MGGMRFTRKKRSNPTILLSSSVPISSSGFKAVWRSTLTQCKRFEKNKNLITEAARFNQGLE